MKVDFSPSPAKSEVESHRDTYTQHFLKTLPRKLHDPSLLQVFPRAPSPVIFKHNDKNELAAREYGTTGKDVPFQGLPEAWGSPEHTFSAPPGSYKLLSSDYAWLDAPRNRRDGNVAGAPGSQQEAEGTQLPEPPLAMQQTRFLAHARLVLVKLRQQLEEVCVGAVRRMETVATAPPVPTDMATPALSTLGSFGGSTAAPTLMSMRSIAAASTVAASGGPSTAATAGGATTAALRLPPGFVDELVDNIRAKLNATFEDCLMDTMDQLWNALQYAGSKHAIVERLAEAMKKREAELEMTAARHREDSISKIRVLRRQKEEVEAAAEKERVELQARAAAASQRMEFLERDLSAMRGAVERERAEGAARLEAQRVAYESALAAKDEAMEAVRADSVARLEEMRVLNAGLQEQLALRIEEVARLSSRASDQAGILALALDRRDGTYKELEALTGQLEDFKRFLQAPAAMPLTDWLLTLQENGSPLTPLMGGPLSMVYGTGRAFLATARHHGLHAVQEELRRIMPSELPWPEDGWPPDGQDNGYDEGTASGTEGTVGSSSPTDMIGKAAYPPTLPLTWLRLARAPLANIMSGPELMSKLSKLARAKREADVVARHHGQSPPDLHTFAYKRILEQESSAMDADEEVISLVQSLRAHAKNLPRAAIWLQMLQLATPVLPPDASTYYMEVFYLLLVQEGAVVDKPACIVWVSPTRWKTLLTGPAGSVFDTERKVALLKQAATVRVDTTRGNKSFGMSEGDALISIIMAQWLSQRQAAIASLATAWSALEPVGGGVLAVNISVDELARVAATALGRDVLPTDRASHLELFFNTLQAARTAQAATRVKWSGLTTTALGTALADAELLSPRPLHPRNSPSRTRLAAAAGQLLRIADASTEQMRAHPVFKQQQCMIELESAITRLRQAVQECTNSREVVRDVIEEERRALLGWVELETMTTALLTAQEAFRLFDASMREQMMKMTVEGLSKRKSMSEEAEKGGERIRSSMLSTRPSILRTSRSKSTTRNLLSSDNGSLPNDGSPVQSPRREPTSVFAMASAQGAVGRISRMGSILPHTASGRAGSARAASRDLRAAMAGAGGQWSSDDEEEQQATTQGPPPTLSLSRRLSRATRSSSKTTPRERIEVPEETLAALVAAAVESPATSADSSAGSNGSTGDGSGSVQTSPPPVSAAAVPPSAAETELSTKAATTVPEAAAVGTPPPATPPPPRATAATSAADPSSESNLVDRLAYLEDKYGRLRSRFSQTVRALNAAYQNAAGDAGAGLPCPEVMSQLCPAAKLRLVAELLAELHREVEEGVWPHLDEALMEAISRTSPGGRVGSRAASRPPSAMVPGVHITALRPESARNAEACTATAAGARIGSAARTVTGSGSVAASDVSTPVAAGLARMPSKLSDVDLELSPGAAAATEGGGDDPSYPVVEAQEVAGLLHAHAGHVGRVISVAAMETAALAAALDDLSSRRSGTSTASLLRGSFTWAGTSDGGGVPGAGTDGGMWPGANGTNGMTQSALSSDGSVASRRRGSTPGRLTASGDIGPLLSGLAPGPATALLRGAATLQTSKGSGLVLPLTPIPTLRPSSAGAVLALQPALSVSNTTSRTPEEYATSAGGAPTVSASGGSVSHGGQAAPQGHGGVWSGITPDADPRDTTYLKALRALHAATESKAVSEGNLTPLVGAVREVVRLLGGQPQIGADGSVIEFYPRRVPTDWRHPMLRNSLTRLYIYVCGALLQQHERGLLLQEAAADLAERHTALVRAAEDLELKAAGLRGLQKALGTQLAALAAWVTHGSVLMSRLEKLDAVGEELKVQMAAVQVSERTSTPVLNPTMLSRSTSMRVQPSALQPSASGAVKNMGVLSRPTSRKVSAGVQTPAHAAAAREVATVAGVAAAAAAAAAAATMVLPLSVDGEGLTASGGAASSSGGVGVPASKAARPPTKIVAVTPDEWDGMKQLVSSLNAAILQLKGSAWPLLELANPALVRETSGLAPPLSPGVPLSPVSVLLPKGDRILAVHVHITSSALSDSKVRLAGADAGPIIEAFGASQLDHDNHLTTTQSLELPQQPKVQQQQDTISFIIDLPRPSTPPGTSAGGSNRTVTAKSPAVHDALSDTEKYPTPPVSPETSAPSIPPAAAATQGYSLTMSLRQAQTAPRSSSAGSALPPGEELVRLSNSLLRRSAMSAVRRHLGGGGGGNGSARGRRPSPPPHPAVDGMGPLPPHYERRPMTARAFVEGVMMQAREQQLERLYGVAGHMPRGAMPELDGLAHTDEHEASRLAQRALVLASPEPKPATALDVLLQEHSEEAAQANVAAVSAVADAVSAAAAAAAGAQSPAGPATPQANAASPMLVNTISPPRQEASHLQARSTSDGSVVHSRLASGVSGTRLSTLPPVGGAALAGMGSDSPLSAPGVHLGYYPGLQVDVAGRLTDWRLPVLTQQTSQRSMPSERGASQQGTA